MSMFTVDQQLKPFIFLVLIACFVSLSIIYTKTNENIGNKREVTAFKGMIVSYLVYCLVDLRLLIGDAFYTIRPRILVLFIISTGFATMSFSCYCWFMHVYANHKSPAWALRFKSVNVWGIILQIPLLINLIILYTPLHVLVYELTDDIAIFKPLNMLILLMDYIYLIAATIISIKNRRKATTRHEKKKYNSQIIYILFFTVSGILIGFLLNLPAIELCVIPVVLKLFVELQDSQIYTDALTKLYNRRRMTEFIGEEIATCSEKDPLTIVMIDLDYFKSINDILGHDDGDKALVTFANALRKTLISRNAVAARWGGDEFVVAGKDADIYADFRTLLTVELENCNDLPYMPRFSIGVYKCTSHDMSMDQAMIKADEVLYRNKEINHRESGDFIEKLKEIARKRRFR